MFILKNSSLAKTFLVTIGFIVTLGFVAFLLVSCSSAREPRYRIGVSQCSEGPWRSKQNAEMERELLLHDGISMELICCHDNSQQQIEDIRSFIDQKVDLIVVSPNEPEDVTPAVAEAFDAGIPVVVFDRQVIGDKYTAFVSGDNEGAGRLLARYALSLSLLSDATERSNRSNSLNPSNPIQRCNILELTGVMTTTPAQMRHRGIIQELEGHPQAKLLASVDAHWSGDDAAAMMDSLLTCYPDVDVVVAHSDWIATAAKAKANELKPGNHIRFAGIDGIVGPGEGIEGVEMGRLDATATYPTGGDIIMQTAIHILEGEPYERETLLESHLVSSAQEAMLTSSMQRAIDKEADDIRALRGRMDYYWQLHSLEKALSRALGALLVLALGFMLTLYLFYRISRRTGESLTRQRATLKEQRDQLLALTRELEEANNAKMNFFTNVSHDFRTPLTLISAPIEQLAQDERLQDPKQRQLLQLAQRNIGLLRRLVNQILDFRKAESGKISLDLQPIDLSSLLSAWTDSFQGLAAKKQIQLTYETRGKDFQTMADEAKMERIFYNIMGNAFKFTPDGGSISVSLAHVGDKYRLCIGDTGPGIPTSDIQKIFDSYYQVGSRRFEGTGLGLALAKNFVELHGGTIRAENQPTGTGSIFTITLPARPIREGQQTIPFIPSDLNNLTNLNNLGSPNALPSAIELDTLEAQEDLSTNDDEPKPIALIIDDNTDIRLFLRTLLADKYRVLSAPDGQEGLRKAQETVPDIIICDVMMPVMDGLECCHRLKTTPATSHIPVLMLTACSMDEQRVRGLEEGADAYIAKPFSSAVLMAQMDSLISNRARIRESIVPDGGFLPEKPIPATPVGKSSSKEPKTSEPSLGHDQREQSPIEPATTPGHDQREPSPGRDQGEQSASPAPVRLSKYDEEFLAKLRQLIERNLSNENYSIELLASDICLSRTQLFRKCKALTGASPVELLRNTRLDAARQLLAEGKGSVAEVASLVGFADASYFTRCYKAYFGTTPHEMNKQKY